MSDCNITTNETISRIEALKDVNISSYCTNGIGSLVWTIVFVILLCKDNKMNRQIFQSFLMIVYHVSSLALNQTYYMLWLNYDECSLPDWYNEERCRIIYCAATFLSISSFIVSHWLFAFDYWRLSYRQSLLS